MHVVQAFPSTLPLFGVHQLDGVQALLHAVVQLDFVRICGTTKENPAGSRKEGGSTPKSRAAFDRAL